MIVSVKENPNVLPADSKQELLDSGWNVVLYNDEVNSFDWVIENLIRYCGHTGLQAEQCAWIVHNSGKCAVKKGSYDELEPICGAMCEKGLSAQLEVQ